ncbi:hypothetical protein BH18ACT17_BH18ACT17_17020 [soil metagenome]
MRRAVVPLALIVLAAVSPIGMSRAAATDRTLVFPNQVRFGKVPVGTSVTKTVTLTNRSDLDVTVFSIGVGGERFTLDFASEDCVGRTLAPGDACSYGIVFAPTSSSRREGGSDLVFAPPAQPKRFPVIRLSGFGT